MKLTAEDLSFMVSLIDNVTVRGAFRGPELFDVGQLRNKIVTILQDVDNGRETAEPDLGREVETGND